MSKKLARFTSLVNLFLFILHAAFVEIFRLFGISRDS
jgi:hypothetical protein